MAKFLAFEDDEGKEVYINAARVRAVRSAGDKQTVVEFDDGHKVGIALLASQSRCQRPREGGLRSFTAFNLEAPISQAGAFSSGLIFPCQY